MSCSKFVILQVPSNYGNILVELAKDMLQRNPNQRPTVVQLLRKLRRHNFFTRPANADLTNMIDAALKTSHGYEEDIDEDLEPEEAVGVAQVRPEGQVHRRKHERVEDERRREHVPELAQRIGLADDEAALACMEQVV